MAAMWSLLLVSVVAVVAAVEEPTSGVATTTATVPANFDGAALLLIEGQRLHQLSQQVSDTNRALEDLLASKLRDVNYASVIAELRSEMDSLRRDVQQMKEEKAASSASNRVTSSENSQKTLHWMQSSLAEMKAEMSDLNRALNVSRQLQLQQETTSQWNLLRRDLSAMQASVADAVAHQQTQLQSVQLIRRDVDDIQRQHSGQAAHLAQLDQDVSDLRMEVQISLKRSEPSVELKTERRGRRLRRSLSHPPARHHHDDVRHEVKALRKMVKTLAAEQHDLQKQMVVLSKMRLATESNLNKIQDELTKVHPSANSADGCSRSISQLETQQLQMNQRLDALNLKVSGVDQVQSSTLQLFEAMEKLQDRYDDSLAQLDKEISKLEFNDAQLTSDVHTLREDQADVNDDLKTVKSRVSIVQESLKSEMIRSALLQTQLVNSTLRSMTSGSVEDVQNWRLSNLEQHYTHIVENLPHDCREVTTSGVNFILPRGSSQVVKVFCDQEVSAGGWTLVQRRTDGKEDFNKNWAAYKSGFGSVHGEFWLGNDHLHQLTRDNATMLRVDLWDIYGQYWWAEYDTFFVDSENNGYAVQFAGYHGNASDAMASYHQNMKFSTRDNDQDLSNTNCADSYQGGWWYSHCQHVNINGKYSLGLTWYDSLENEWIALAKVEMKIRDKRNFSPSSSNNSNAST